MVRNHQGPLAAGCTDFRHPGFGHCDWSNRFLDIHDLLEVRGSFTDDCEHVRCSSDGAGHDWSCR